MQMGGNMDAKVSSDRESQTSDAKRGGWITFPFIAGTITGLGLAGGGWSSNLIVYLIEKFNINSIDASQIFSVVNGCMNLFPVIGAIVADSFLGCFSVVFISSLFSLLGIIFLALTASLDCLRPPSCTEIGTSLCETPSKLQFTILYAGLAIASIGLGGARYIVATMGANQFDKPQDHAIYFNWYFIAAYSSKVISATAIVYIEDNVSWRLGFGLCIAANLAALVILLAGTRLYRHDKPQGSAFIGLVRVVVAAARKRKAMLSSRIEDYHQQEQNDEMIKIEAVTPKQNFRFLNRAALKIEGDIRPDGSIAKPWKLCTIQQVEDLKALIRILPIWSTIIFLATPIGILNNLVILQALTMDRHLGHNFKIPAGSFSVICMISGFIFVSLKDRLLRPTWQKIIHRSPTTLQLVGIGYMLSLISMVVSALVESKRLKIAHNVHHQQPMSALWLFPQLILLGIGEAFHLPGQAAFYYQEFPASLKSTSAAMIGMMIGICYYLSTALIDLVRRFTDWLPDNINSGRLDNVYWTLAVLAGINFGYYLLCSIMYKYKDGGGSGSDDN